MTEHTALSLRADYLARLDAALEGVPFGVARELREGIAEELDQLDAPAVAQRIAELGDPADIARAAMDSGTAAPPTVITPAPIITVQQVVSPPLLASRGWMLFAALALCFGGIIILGFGWFIGVVLVCLGQLWHPWEKALAIALPWLYLAIWAALTWIVHVVAPAEDATGSPLLPSGYDSLYSGMLTALLVIVPISAIWLIVRAHRRIHPLVASRAGR